MLRFFNTKLSFGTESTAIKILYFMKDLHRDNQPPAKYAYPGNGRYDSDYIADKNFLVSMLSKAILESIDYEQYKNLATSEKNNIKMAIARYLYSESGNYESSYYAENEGGAWGCGSWDHEKAKGVSFSTQFKDYPYDEAYEVNFPKELFLDQLRLKNYICAALEKYSAILHKKENTSLNLACDL